MAELEYLNISVTNNSRVPLLLKEIFASDKKVIHLHIDEPVEWLRTETQLRFLNHKIEERGKKIVVVSNNQEVIATARSASIDVQTGIPEQQPQSSNVLEIPKQKGVVKKQRQQTTGASITISKKDKTDPSKDRVVVKSEYELSDKDATGKFSFSPKRGTTHNFSIQKQFSKGFFSKALSKNKQPQTSQSSTKQTAQNEKGGKLSASAFLNGVVQRKKLTAVCVVIVVVCILIIFFATSVLPSATIKLTPYTREESIAYNFIADANISTNDFQQNSIPSQIIESTEEKTYKVPTGGTQDVEEYAEGEITIYNEYGSESQTLVQGTRFAASNGKVFRIIDQVTVPGATLSGGKVVPSSITVKVRAYEIGESYNIGPSSFSIPGFRTTDKYYKFYGESKNSMTGGASGIRKIITQEDIDTVRRQAREELFSRVQADLRKKIPDGFIAVEETLRSDFDTQKEGQQPQAGDIADELVMKIVARARIVLIREDDASALFDQYLVENDIYDNADEELGDTRTIDYAVRENEYSRGVTRLTMNVTQSFRRTINTDLLFAEIAGKNAVEVRRILSEKEEFQRVYLRFWPFWVKTVPSDKQDVEFDIQYID